MRSSHSVKNHPQLKHHPGPPSAGPRHTNSLFVSVGNAWKILWHVNQCHNNSRNTLLCSRMSIWERHTEKWLRQPQQLVCGWARMKATKAALSLHLINWTGERKCN